MKEDFIIEFIEWGLDKKYFTLEDIKSKFNEDSNEYKFICYETCRSDGPSTLLTSCELPDKDTIFMISSTARFNYLDYMELKFAQKNASDAKKIAIIAMIMGSISVILFEVLKEFDFIWKGIAAILISLLVALMIIYMISEGKNEIF